MSQTPQNLEDVMKVYKALVVDLPLASTRWALGLGNDQQTTQIVWQGYDAGVRLATAAVDALYRSQSVSEVVGNTINQLLRWQQLGSTLTNVITASVWKPLGLPTAAEMRTLSAQVQTREPQLDIAAPQRLPQRQSHRSQTVRPVQEPVHPRTEVFTAPETRAAA